MSSSWFRRFRRRTERALFPRHFKKREFRFINQYRFSDLHTEKPVEPELVLLPILLRGRHQPVCVDVGANRGHYLYVLEQLTATANILAIEPEPSNVAYIKLYFPGLCLLEMAASDHEGVAELKVPIMGEQIYTSRATLEHFLDVGETQAYHHQVRLETLDHLVRQHRFGRVDFLKIDVEGHELQVLHGARRILTEDRPRLLIEIEQRHHQEPVSRVFHELRELGYHGWFIDACGGDVLPLDQFDLARDQDLQNMKTAAYVNNFFFLPAEEAALAPELRQAVRQAATA